ncbi:MAG TPA: hypothetical protein VG406_03720 [Isosphaeraceae bacterium]|jgi:hypothetical protein|nr:hypothetical protein [Isosphaeraceae bacterium]
MGETAATLGDRPDIRAIELSVRRGAKIKDLRRQLAELTSQRDEAMAALEETITDRDALQGRLSAEPSELQAQLDEARGQLRTIKHRDRFGALAKDGAHGLSPDAVDAAWELSGYQAEGDLVDDKALVAAIRRVVATHPVLKAPAETTTAARPGGDRVGSPTNGLNLGARPAGPAPGGQDTTQGHPATVADVVNRRAAARGVRTDGRLC